jgi:GAF domain-containing protein
MSSKLSAALTDQARLADLRRLRLLDTPPEVPFDRLTRLAARVLNAPVALVSLVDDTRQFFKSAVGLPEPWATRRETPLTHSFCKFVVASASPLVIGDARNHPDLCDNPAVVSLNVVAYLGMPLAVPNGSTLGSFCVIDTRPRTWTSTDQANMTDLASSVMSEIALRFAYEEMHAAHSILQRELLDREHLLHTLQHSQSVLRDAHIRTSTDGFSMQTGNGAVHSEHDTAAPDHHDPSAALDLHREQLTKRQREVFDLLMHGLQTKDVARQLNLSHRTVEAHRAKILEQFHVSSFTQLLQKFLARPDKS